MVHVVIKPSRLGRSDIGMSDCFFQKYLDDALVEEAMMLSCTKTKRGYNLLKKYLSYQRFFHPQDPVKTYEDTARIYFYLRKKGVTIRSTIDCLPAQIALEQDLLLRHNDKDFDAMAPIFKLHLYKH
ncbi:MAG: PIN domain nuclease [Deltaproteobacteria bacterium]|nr:PIN domain nuclease [Deltaproteobacteria bacterium]